MIKDPFNNQVAIQQEILQFTDQMKSENEILDDIITVIEKPAMMFKINGSKTQLCYMRAVGWNKMMLVSVEKTQDYFEITSCEFDPSAKRLAELYHWADQLI